MLTRMMKVELIGVEHMITILHVTEVAFENDLRNVSMLKKLDAYLIAIISDHVVALS